MNMQKILKALQASSAPESTLSEDEKKEYHFINEAHKFYISQGYGTKDTPIEQFVQFLPQYTKAFEFYKEQGFSDGLAMSHLHGIDFNKPIAKVVLQEGTLVTQTQVPWGGQGCYYSTSDFTPSEMGIAHKGKKWQFPKERTFDTTQEKSAYEAQFPQLNTTPTQPSPAVIVDKSMITYRVNKDITVLQSTAKAILDTWSSNTPIQTKGGGMQYFNATKATFVKYDLGANDKHQHEEPLFKPRTP